MENLENNVVTEEVQAQETKTEEQVKMFTQEEVDQMIAKRIAREAKKIEAEKQKAYQAQLEAELKESERLMQMNEADRLKAKAEKERKQFEEEKRMFNELMKAFEQQKIRNQTMQMLDERKIPVALAQFITSENADEIMDNVNTFQKCFDEAVEQVVAERLKGKSPSTSTVSKNTFSMEQLRGMSVEEINKNWASIKNNLK
jgi:hypothetical protein